MGKNSSAAGNDFGMREIKVFSPAIRFSVIAATGQTKVQKGFDPLPIGRIQSGDPEIFHPNPAGDR